MPGTWTQTSIADKPASIYDLSAGVQPRGCILFLHDADLVTPSGNPNFTALLDQHRLACVCPGGDGSWWLDRPCHAFDPSKSAERYLLDDVVPFMHSRWSLPSSRLGLLGLGMGGQGALRLAFRHPQVFQVVAGINSIVDFHELYHEGTALDEMYDSKEQCRQDTVILHVHPSEYPAHIYFCCDPANQRWFRGNDRLHEKLGALGIAHEIDLTTEAGGQSWPYADLMAERVMRFLATGLEQQARRLL